MSSIQTRQIGFIGIGRMGMPMASRLIDAGYQLVVFDTNANAVQALMEKGATRADSPQDVADATEVVLLSLPVPQVVKDVATGAQGLISGSRVKVVVDLSTTGATMAKQVAKELADKGIAWIDCPVSGGIAGAEKGTLALMASGEREVYEALEPVLSNLGKLFYVGGGAGMGQTMKVLNNLISVTALTITSEALVVGAKAGLDPDAMVDVINAGSGKTGASMDKIPKHVLTRSFDFGFAIGLSAKDVRLCLEEAVDLGVPMQVGRAVVDFVQNVKDRFGDQADLTELIRAIEQDAGVEVRGKNAKV